MNYGYAPTDKDQELSQAIEKYVATLPPDANRRQPYVELNGLYAGVRIRRITHYPEDFRYEIAHHCDEIYDRIIGL